MAIIYQLDPQMGPEQRKNTVVGLGLFYKFLVATGLHWRRLRCSVGSRQSCNGEVVEF